MHPTEDHVVAPIPSPQGADVIHKCLALFGSLAVPLFMTPDRFDERGKPAVPEMFHLAVCLLPVLGIDAREIHPVSDILRVGDLKGRAAVLCHLLSVRSSVPDPLDRVTGIAGNDVHAIESLGLAQSHGVLERYLGQTVVGVPRIDLGQGAPPGIAGIEERRTIGILQGTVVLRHTDEPASIGIGLLFRLTPGHGPERALLVVQAAIPGRVSSRPPPGPRLCGHQSHTKGLAPVPEGRNPVGPSRTGQCHPQVHLHIGIVIVPLCRKGLFHDLVHMGLGVEVTCKNDCQQNNEKTHLFHDLILLLTGNMLEPRSVNRDLSHQQTFSTSPALSHGFLDIPIQGAVLEGHAAWIVFYPLA